MVSFLGVRTDRKIHEPAEAHIPQGVRALTNNEIAGLANPTFGQSRSRRPPEPKALRAGLVRSTSLRGL